jgi:hypothetical protein
MEYLRRAAKIMKHATMMPNTLNDARCMRYLDPYSTFLEHSFVKDVVKNVPCSKRIKQEKTTRMTLDLASCATILT